MYSAKGLVTGARRRLISKKGGRTNITLENTSDGARGFRDFVLRDMFTGAIDMPWR